MTKYTPGQAIIAFWNKVNKDGSIPAHCPELGQCWEWTGGLTSQGYGSIVYGGENTVSHRVAWKLAYGKIPPKMVILHKCDNPKCVRPEHLSMGTHQNNSDDMVAKNRSNSLIKTNKLTVKDIATIRNSYSWFDVTMKMLAIQYGISVATVFDIIHRKRLYGKKFTNNS